MNSSVEVAPNVWMGIQGYCDEYGTKPWGANYTYECWSTDSEVIECELGIRVKNYIDEFEIDGWDALLDVLLKEDANMNEAQDIIPKLALITDEIYVQNFLNDNDLGIFMENDESVFIYYAPPVGDYGPELIGAIEKVGTDSFFVGTGSVALTPIELAKIAEYMVKDDS